MATTFGNVQPLHSIPDAHPRRMLFSEVEDLRCDSLPRLFLDVAKHVRFPLDLEVQASTRHALPELSHPGIRFADQLYC